MKIGRAVVMVKHISLINLIAGKEVIRELIQEEAHATIISAELEKLVSDRNYRDGLIRDYDDIYSLLDTGSASENTAKLMVGYLRQYPT